MKIGQLAQTTGLSTKTIRYYEDIGVLPEPERQVNGYRTYEKTVVDRLAFIRDAQASGLSLIEIQWILELREEGKSTCGHTISLLESHLVDLETQMTELDRTKKRLIGIIDRAKSLDPAECNDPDRCQTISHFKVE